MYFYYSATATPKIPTTAIIPAATAPVDWAAPPVEVLELMVAASADVGVVCGTVILLGGEVTAEDPAGEVVEPVVEVIEPVLLALPLPAVAPDFALEFAVTLFNSAAAVAIPTNPVYVCR